MPTKTYDVKTVQVVQICENCRDGEQESELVATGGTDRRVLRPMYTHECKNCPNIEYFDKKYPYTKQIRNGEVV